MLISVIMLKNTVSKLLRNFENDMTCGFSLVMIFSAIMTFDPLSVAVHVQGGYPLENSSVLTYFVLKIGQFS